MSEAEKMARGIIHDANKPIPISVARQLIRGDFLKLADLVIKGVNLPPGHKFANKPAWELRHQLNWNMGCEVRSSEGGLSISGGLEVADESDSSQLQIEVRYHHPSMRITNEKGTAFTARPYSDASAAALWVDKGRPFSGMTTSHISEGRNVKASSITELADSVIAKLRAAILLAANPN